jgi:hypothetical protein
MDRWELSLPAQPPTGTSTHLLQLTLMTASLRDTIFGRGLLPVRVVITEDDHTGSSVSCCGVCLLACGQGERLRGLSIGMLAGSLAGNVFCLKGFVELLQVSIADG